MTKKLSERLVLYRTDLPNEWLMDEFKRDAEALEQRIVELESQFRINPTTGEATFPSGLSVGSIKTSGESTGFGGSDTRPKSIVIGEGTCCDNAEKLRKAEQRIKELESHSGLQAQITLLNGIISAAKADHQHSVPVTVLLGMAHRLEEFKS